MLDFKKVKRHAGMKLVGDYSTLRGLHELIHKVASSSPLLREASQSEFLLGLAYDVRKAFERQRDIIKPPRHATDMGVRYGVNVLWPVYLVQVRLLREAMGFMPTDERDQGVAFLLEHATLAGLTADVGGSEIVMQWRRLRCNPATLTALVDSRAGIFLSWNDAERKQGLGQILESLDPMFVFDYERGTAAWQAGIRRRRSRWRRDGPIILILVGDDLAIDGQAFGSPSIKAPVAISALLVLDGFEAFFAGRQSPHLEHIAVDQVLPA